MMSKHQDLESRIASLQDSLEAMHAEITNLEDIQDESLLAKINELILNNKNLDKLVSEIDKINQEGANNYKDKIKNLREDRNKILDVLYNAKFDLLDKFVMDDSIQFDDKKSDDVTLEEISKRIEILEGIRKGVANDLNQINLDNSELIDKGHKTINKYDTSISNIKDNNLKIFKGNTQQYLREEQSDQLLRINKKLDLYKESLSPENFQQLKNDTMAMVESTYQKMLREAMSITNINEALKFKESISYSLLIEHVSLFSAMREKYQSLLPEADKTVKTSSKQNVTDDLNFPELKAVESTSEIPGGLLPAEQPIKVLLQNGALYHADQNTLLDTSKGLSHMKEGYMSFVLKKDGLYLFNHFDGFDRISHATYADEAIFAAGEMRVINGKLQTMTSYSGHFKPDELHMFNAISYMQRANVDMAQTVVQLKFPLNDHYQIEPAVKPDAKVSAQYDVKSTNAGMISYHASDLYQKMKPHMTPVRVELLAKLKMAQDKVVRPDYDGAFTITDINKLKNDILQSELTPSDVKLINDRLKNFENKQPVSRGGVVSLESITNKRAEVPAPEVKNIPKSDNPYADSVEDNTKPNYSQRISVSTKNPDQNQTESEESNPSPFGMRPS